MNIKFTPNALEELEYWKSTNNAVLLKIFSLLEDIQKTPFKGLGKPELCRHDLAKKWSRRITNEHRLVYQVEGKGEDKTLTIYQCRYHYDD